MGGRCDYAPLRSDQTDATLAPLAPCIPIDTGWTAQEGDPPLTERRDSGEDVRMNAISGRQRHLPRAFACSPSGKAGAMVFASGYQCSSPLAGGIGKSEARDEGIGRPISGQGRAPGIGVQGLSGRSGRRVVFTVRQNRILTGNAAPPECESKSMYGNRLTRYVRVGAAPARGVMGGLVRSVLLPAVPPVSSLTGPFAVPSMTAPAPIGVPAGEVSPRAGVVRATWHLEPAGRQLEGAGIPPGAPPG